MGEKKAKGGKILARFVRRTGRIPRQETAKDDVQSVLFKGRRSFLDGQDATGGLNREDYAAKWWWFCAN